MAGKELIAGLEPGAQLFDVTEHLDRDALVRYAGASGDFNTIHYNQTAAVAAGLPDVIAHGMLTMGVAAAALESWLGDPTAVSGFGVRFSAMVPVPYPQGNDVRIVGRLGASDDQGARIELKVTTGQTTVLAKTFADIRFL